MKLEQQSIKYDRYEYSVSSLITASKDFKVKELEVAYLYKGGSIIPDTSILEFAIAMKKVMNVCLDFPIILSPLGTILDGHHRLTKAMYLGLETIKAVKFDTMPKIGFKD